MGQLAFCDNALRGSDGDIWQGRSCLVHLLGNTCSGSWRMAECSFGQVHDIAPSRVFSCCGYISIFQASIGCGGGALTDVSCRRSWNQDMTTAADPMCRTTLSSTMRFGYDAEETRWGSKRGHDARMKLFPTYLRPRSYLVFFWFRHVTLHVLSECYVGCGRIPSETFYVKREDAWHNI